MIFFLFGFASHLSAQRPHARLPFWRGELWRDTDGPVVVSLTEKEAKRCVEAMEWYIESHADQMIDRGLELEVARYEDLLYRFMGVPDQNMKMHVQQRKEDRLN